MRKFSITLVVLLVCLVALLRLPSLLVDRISAAGVEMVSQRAAKAGVDIQALEYRQALYRFPATIVWKDVSARLLFSEQAQALRGQDMDMAISELRLKMLEPVSLFHLTGKGMELGWRSHGSQVQGVPVGDRLEQCRFTVMFGLDILNADLVKSQVAALVDEARNFIFDGRTTLPVDFQGRITFRIRGEEVQSALGVVREGGEYGLAMNPESFLVVAWLLEEELTVHEVDLFSRHPLKVPRLLRIRNQAQETAKQANAADPYVPQDAYRHVLWSYLLTKAYGAEFAKKATDAHEQGMTDDTEAEKRMDYQNNRVGREYALDQVAREDVLSRLLKDTQVIRYFK